jgi:hypothetical protein
MANSQTLHLQSSQFLSAYSPCPRLLAAVYTLDGGSDGGDQGRSAEYTTSLDLAVSASVPESLDLASFYFSFLFVKTKEQTGV